MKRKIIFILTVCITLYSATAAQGLKLGLTAGFNSFKFEGQTWDERFKSGYYIGAVSEIMLSDKIGIQPEVQIQFSKTTDPNGDNVKTQSLNVPLLFTWKPVNLLSIQFGPQYTRHIDGWSDIQLLDRELYRKENLSLLGGLQLNIPFIRIGARIDQGLMNLNNFESMDKIKSLGYRVYIAKMF